MRLAYWDTRPAPYTCTWCVYVHIRNIRAQLEVPAGAFLQGQNQLPAVAFSMQSRGYITLAGFLELLPNCLLSLIFAFSSFLSSCLPSRQESNYSPGWRRKDRVLNCLATHPNRRDAYVSDSFPESFNVRMRSTSMQPRIPISSTFSIPWGSRGTAPTHRRTHGI